MAIKDNLKKIMAKSGTSQAELARNTTSNQPTIQRILSGETSNPKINTIINFKKALRTSYEELLEGKSYDQIQEESSTYNANTKVPRLGYLQAGNPTDYLNNQHPDISYTLDPDAKNEFCFILTFEGDSMTAPTGSPDSFSHGTDGHFDSLNKSPKNEQYIVAKIAGQGKATFKQYKLDEGTPYLHPLNPNHPNIFEEFEVIGVLYKSSKKF